MRIARGILYKKNMLPTNSDCCYGLSLAGDIELLGYFAHQCRSCEGDGQVRCGIKPYSDECAVCTACNGAGRFLMSSDLNEMAALTPTQREVDERLKKLPMKEWTWQDLASFVYGFQVLDRDIKPRVTWVGDLVSNILSDGIEGESLVGTLEGMDSMDRKCKMPDRPGLLQELLDLEEQWLPQGLEGSGKFWSELFVTLYNIYKRQPSQDGESWTPKTWKELCAYAEAHDL